jgi:GT2 family glycosyltransferase
VIAFTDDDCEPAPDWLARAHGWFRDARVAGLEGRIDSDQTDEVRYRVVTNVGFEGFGFMTANLFLRRDVFEDLGGFDERFDAPHFREDTDLAWRALSHGTIPFARDVRVLHPAHPRVSVRESSAERSSFFVHDALLFHKHPDRYLDLLRREGHGKRGEFWAEFAKGILRHRTAGPIEKLAAFTTPDALRALADARGQLENQGEAPVTGARPGESDDPRP